MDENKEEKSTPNNTGERSEPKSTQLIDDANLAAKRMEDANKEKRELLDREEELAARKALGGRSEAGQETTPKFSEEEIASRKRIKNIADASGASWGKNYE